MKQVNIDRFQKKKPEEITFAGSPIPDRPPLPEQAKENFQKERMFERTKVKQPRKRKKKRSSERRNEWSQEVSETGYLIKLPKKRRKTRHSFDIFEDQKSALEKIQLAVADYKDSKKPLLGKLVQEALDLYIKQKAKELKNIHLIKGD